MEESHVMMRPTFYSSSGCSFNKSKKKLFLAVFCGQNLWMCSSK